MNSDKTDETVEGYLLDVGCLRGYAREETLDRARQHRRDCLLMGHCIESGYAVVSDDDRVTVLDSEATHRVLEIARTTAKAEGIKVRAQRTRRDGQMETIAIEEIAPCRDRGRPEKPYPE